ncbi:MAG: PhnE/PtxC family ABC transporter permease [Candidatus Promineifilaceae bacterium]
MVSLLGASYLVGFSATLVENVLYGIVAFAFIILLLWLIVGPLGKLIGRSTSDGPIRGGLNILRAIAAGVLALLGVALAAQFGVLIGGWLEEILGLFGFLGNLVFVLSDLVRFILPAFTALLIGVLGASYASRYAQEAEIKWPALPAKILTAIVSAFGTFIIIFAIGSALNWLYSFDQPQRWTTFPALIGGAVVGIVGFLLKANQPLPIGSVIYLISRSILNVLRSIEPLIMGIVFVVWVAIGPFAGIMALTLHSIAALGKLFSEQIEGIDEGPVEAVTATGANSIQRVWFAVIPQIIPPFTAFALYRWDINVRMSTIIGFVGGGGIGYVLTQNIRLLRYHDAAVMMIAIAVVVAALDYASSKIRTRII